MTMHWFPKAISEPPPAPLAPLAPPAPHAAIQLTDEEREAIEDAIKTVSESLDLMNGEDSFTTATLRNLLERLK